MNKRLEHPSIQNFINAAKEYISLIEEEESIISNDNFCMRVQELLIELYKYGWQLPTIELDESKDSPDTDTEIRDLSKSIGDRLGIGSYYWVQFDPTWTADPELPTLGCLIDDLSDIYKDIKSAYVLITHKPTKSSIESGLWDLHFSFHHHWGDHCINALRALHYLDYPGKKK